MNRKVVYGGLLSSFWVPLAQAIVAGLTFATLLTLLATPALLAMPYRASVQNIAALVERIKSQLRAKWTLARKRRPRLSPESRSPLAAAARATVRRKRKPRR